MLHFEELVEPLTAGARKIRDTVVAADIAPNVIGFTLAGRIAVPR